MATDPTSPPQFDGQSEATSKRSRTTTRLRTLTLRTVDQPRPAVYVDTATGRASGPMREKFHSYLGVVAREKVPIIHNNWKGVPETLKEIVWNDILAKFDIAEATKVKTKTEGQQTQDVVTKYGLDPEAWKQFEETRLTPNWEGIRKRAQSIQKHNDCPHVLSRGGYDLLEKKLLDQKRKRIQEEALLSENPASVDEPPSPIKRHVKWKVARTRAVGNMTSDSAQEIADKIVTQGSFVPHGRQDILNTAIGRPDHGGRVRAAGSGVTITQYYGRASRTCSSSSTSISQQQLDEVVARLREDMTGQIREELRTQIKEELRTQLEEENRRSLEIMTNALKEAIKKELSNKGSQEALQIQPDIQQLGARVSTQGSNVVTNAQASQEHDADAIPLMGLFVQRNDGTQRLVAMGKIMEGDSIIHTVAYADDVVRVSVETVIDPEAEAVYTFVAWPTHLVKAVLDEHPQSIPHNEDAHVPKPANVDADDPLRGLMKYSFDIYDKPLEISFDGSFLGIVDASTSIFITYSDVTEIIAGDKSLNISVIQLWLIQGFMYAFLEPQSLVCSKDRRSECEQYLERWLKESDREVYIGPYFHHVMTKLKKTLSPETKAVAPKWIEVKSHVQTGCYECGYYIMHWIWNIITSDIKSDWSMWFANDTPLDFDIITTIRKKWAAFFLKTAINFVTAFSPLMMIIVAIMGAFILSEKIYLGGFVFEI
ncbi:WAT1-related protein [Glycine soja]